MKRIEALRRIPVTFFPDASSDAKHKVAALQNLCPTPSMAVEDPYRAKALDEYRRLLQGSNLDELPRTRLWNGVKDHVQRRYIERFENIFNEDQMSAVRYLCDNLVATLASVIGPGGTGKSLVAISLALPFLEGVWVSETYRERRDAIRSKFLTKLIRGGISDNLDAESSHGVLNTNGTEIKTTKTSAQFPVPKDNDAKVWMRAPIMCLADHNEKVDGLYAGVLSAVDRLPCPFQPIMGRLHSIKTEMGILVRLTNPKLDPKKVSL